MQTITIKTIAELIEKLKSTTIPKSGNRQQRWFRGHSDINWKLLPGYQRLTKPPPESVLINMFKQNANLLLSKMPGTDFEWLFDMQHYGVPTRLLDWTESPLVALYFSVNENQDKDGAIWMLLPVKLNQMNKTKPEDYDYVPSCEDDRVKSYMTSAVEANPDLQIDPMAVIATRNNPRIQAQLGVFTISHNAVKPLEKLADEGILTCFKIPKSSKKKLLVELDLIGFSKFQVFPELSVVGEVIKEKIK